MYFFLTSHTCCRNPKEIRMVYKVIYIRCLGLFLLCIFVLFHHSFQYITDIWLTREQSNSGSKKLFSLNPIYIWKWLFSIFTGSNAQWCMGRKACRFRILLRSMQLQRDNGSAEVFFLARSHWYDRFTARQMRRWIT